MIALKGQYLAIETMLTFGMGIAVALGTITVFGDYKDNMMETTQDKQAEMINSEVHQAVFNLEKADSGYTTVELPERVGGTSYTLALANGVRVMTGPRTYSRKFSNLNPYYNFSGSVEGGTVKIYKRQDQFILRPD